MKRRVAQGVDERDKIIHKLHQRYSSTRDKAFDPFFSAIQKIDLYSSLSVDELAHQIERGLWLWSGSINLEYRWSKKVRAFLSLLLRRPIHMPPSIELPALAPIRRFERTSILIAYGLEILCESNWLYQRKSQLLELDYHELILQLAELLCYAKVSSRDVSQVMFAVLVFKLGLDNLCASADKSD